MNSSAISNSSGDLDRVLVGSRNAKIHSLVEGALSQTAMAILPVDSVNKLMFELLRRRIHIVVMDHSIISGIARETIKYISHILPRVSIIIIAQDSEDAETMNVEIGGCVHHLFLGIPSENHLRQFVQSARGIQHSRLERVRNYA